MAIGAVVLNYVDWTSTVTCVRSILRCDPPPERIIVVDNDSGNDSMLRLSAEFEMEPRVVIMQSGRNGGYAYGNNVGIHYLVRAGVRHVVIATSDTEVLSPGLFAELEAAVAPGVGIIGPQILAPGGLQNPAVERLTLKYLLDLVWLQHGMPGLGLRRLLRMLKRGVTITSPVTAAPAPSPDRSRPVYMLHGSFLCLTDTFLHKFGELDERLFMFGEEDLLAWQCARHGLLQVLLNNVAVRHADDVSTDIVWGRAATAFKDRELRKSARVLKKEISPLQVLRIWRAYRLGSWNGADGA